MQMPDLVAGRGAPGHIEDKDESLPGTFIRRRKVRSKKNKKQKNGKTRIVKKTGAKISTQTNCRYQPFEPFACTWKPAYRNFCLRPVVQPFHDDHPLTLLPPQLMLWLLHLTAAAGFYGCYHHGLVDRVLVLFLLRLAFASSDLSEI